MFNHGKVVVLESRTIFIFFYLPIHLGTLPVCLSATPSATYLE